MINTVMNKNTSLHQVEAASMKIKTKILPRTKGLDVFALTFSLERIQPLSWQDHPFEATNGLEGTR